MCRAGPEYKLTHLKVCVCLCFKVCVTEKERDLKAAGFALFFTAFIVFCLRNWKRICMDDVFLPLRRGQISEEHYRWLIMNDRLIKLI